MNIQFKGASYFNPQYISKSEFSTLVRDINLAFPDRKDPLVTMASKNEPFVISTMLISNKTVLQQVDQAVKTFAKKWAKKRELKLEKLYAFTPDSKIPQVFTEAVKKQFDMKG